MPLADLMAGGCSCRTWPAFPSQLLVLLLLLVLAVVLLLRLLLLLLVEVGEVVVVVLLQLLLSGPVLAGAQTGTSTSAAQTRAQPM